MSGFIQSIKFLSAGGIIVLVIFILSVIALAVIIERFFYYGKLRKKTGEVFDTIRNIIAAKEYNNLKPLVEQNRKLPFVKVFQTALDNASRVDSQELKEIVEDEGYRQSYHLAGRLQTLATIGTVSPLLGLLGTVTGMIKSFLVIANAGGNPEQLASGIAEALITTAAGLIVAIPVVIFHNILQTKNRLLSIDMEEKMSHLFKFIKGSGKENI